jgi:hydroxymethylglutaryl-CoA lyase
VADRVTVFEVGPRDGLQNEPSLRDKVATSLKIRFVNDLVAAGVTDFELGAFVRPDKVPQMADTEALYRAIASRKLKLRKARAWSLVPNLKGLERAVASGATRIAVFTAASEGFAQANIGMSVSESLREYSKVVAQARRQGLRVRGYVSTAFGCPFDGKVSPARALGVIERLAELGVEQVSVGDTIGVATPAGVDAVMRPALRMLGARKVAGHFHDTRGTALANALRSLDLGVRTLDASAGGLGGCPFAPGATGNLATEDLVYMLHGMGMKTGIDLKRLSEASLAFSKKLKRPIASRYLQAYASSR